MKTLIFSIRDNKAEAYLRPFFERTNQTAERAVQKAMETDFDFAEDYALYTIGAFNDSTGSIERWAPIHLINLVDLKTPAEKEIQDIRLRQKAAFDTAEKLRKDMTPNLNIQGGE